MFTRNMKGLDIRDSVSLNVYTDEESNKFSAIKVEATMFCLYVN